MLKRRGRAWLLIKKDFFVLNAAAFFAPGAAVPRKATTFFKAWPPADRQNFYFFLLADKRIFLFIYKKMVRQAIKLCIGWILQRSFWEKAVLPLRPVVY